MSEFPRAQTIGAQFRSVRPWPRRACGRTAATRLRGRCRARFWRPGFRITENQRCPDHILQDVVVKPSIESLLYLVVTWGESQKCAKLAGERELSR
eukprot:3057400-Pyramimonas_sp.AAC.1